MSDEPAAVVPSPLKRMAVPKRSAVLVEELRDRILGGTLPPGSMLPPERTLVEQTGLSRMTVREALRLLEAEGLLTIRPGRAGGAVVRRLDGSGVSRHLDLYIRSRGVPLATLLEVWEELAPACAALAARRRTPGELEALHTAAHHLAGTVEDLPAFVEAYQSWLLLLARVSGNEVMRAVMESTTRAIWDLARAARFQDVELNRLAGRAQLRVLEAVAAGDEDAARRRMARHVRDFSATAAEVPGLNETLAPLPQSVD